MNVPENAFDKNTSMGFADNRTPQPDKNTSMGKSDSQNSAEELANPADANEEEQPTTPDN
ncbi:MAG: hypothetical protein JWQ79_3690 [Mucilaginibacter sp.]|jgi:hypothetical protein|nr:hypothetical protein [Mucilaginibacter sp.]